MGSGGSRGSGDRARIVNSPRTFLQLALLVLAALAAARPTYVRAVLDRESMRRTIDPLPADIVGPLVAAGRVIPPDAQIALVVGEIPAGLDAVYLRHRVRYLLIPRTLVSDDAGVPAKYLITIGSSSAPQSADLIHKGGLVALWKLQ